MGDSARRPAARHQVQADLRRADGTSIPGPSGDSRRFLSVKEFSALTGLSPATVWRRIRAGGIPAWQPGGRRTRVLIPLEALGPPPPADFAYDRGAPTNVLRAAPRLPGPQPEWQRRSPFALTEPTLEI